MIRIEAVWLAVEPLDMRAGTDTAVARVVKVEDRRAPTTLTCSRIDAPIASRCSFMTVWVFGSAPGDCIKENSGPGVLRVDCRS